MSIKLGNNAVSLALGSTSINKAYLGNDEVYSNVVLPYDSRVEYLQSSGSQWINTGFVPTQDDLRIIIDASTVNGDMLVYGINGTSPRLNLNWYNTTIYFRYRNNIGTFAIANDGQRHILENGPVIKIDGVEKATPTFSPSVTFVGNAKKLVLFGTANAPDPTGANYIFKGKIYEFWIYYGDDLQMHLLPVRKNGVGYMYDTVSGELFGNAGTGAFTYGNDV